MMVFIFDILDIGDVPVFVNFVCYDLSSSVRKINKVRSSDYFAIAGFSMTKVFVRSFILHGVVKLVEFGGLFSKIIKEIFLIASKANIKLKAEKPYIIIILVFGF